MEVAFKTNQLIADTLTFLKNILSDDVAIDVAVMEREVVSLSKIKHLIRFSEDGRGPISLSALKALGVLDVFGNINSHSKNAQSLDFRFDVNRIDLPLVENHKLCDVSRLILDAALFKACHQALFKKPYDLLVVNIESISQAHPEIQDYLQRDLRYMLLARITPYIEFLTFKASDAFKRGIEKEIRHAEGVADDELPIMIDASLLINSPVPLPQIAIENELIIDHQCDWISVFANQPEAYQQKEHDAKKSLLTIRQEIIEQTLSEKGWGVIAQWVPNVFKTGKGLGDACLLPTRVARLLTTINYAFHSQVLDDEHFQVAMNNVYKQIMMFEASAHSSEASQDFFAKQKAALVMKGLQEDEAFSLTY